VTLTASGKKKRNDNAKKNESLKSTLNIPKKIMKREKVLRNS
tara:strand:+ start:96 stop:221 length:126 start_codon:yes stop_codon:yes gene_type:complete